MGLMGKGAMWRCVGQNNIGKLINVPRTGYVKCVVEKIMYFIGIYWEKVCKLYVTHVMQPFNYA